MADRPARLDRKTNAAIDQLLRILPSSWHDRRFSFQEDKSSPIQSLRQTRPASVTELVLVAVAATSRREIDWLTEDMNRMFPEAWDRFAAESGRMADERIVCAYARRLTQADPWDRAQAADAWDAWEATHMRRPGVLHEDPVMRAVYATLVTHYWSHDGFLVGDAAILNRATDLQDIATVLIHGRLDVSGPAITAWQLHHEISGSRLSIVEEEGHGGPVMMQQMCAAIDAFAT